jgi:biotin carboxylase
MENKEVFIIESNSAGNGTKALINAKNSGYTTHFLTNMPEKYHKMDPNPLKLAHHVTFIDTMDIIQLLHFFEGRNPAAIMTFDDFHIIPAAVVANSTGNITPSLTGLVNVRFKDKTRTKTKGIGYPVQYCVIDSKNNLVSSPIGYPCIVKPVDESGSVGVSLCLTDIDFTKACKKIDDFYSNITGYKYIKKILIEEYIVGEEYSAEMCWNVKGNSWEIIGFTKKTVSEPPYFIEIGHTFPHYFDGTIEETIKETIFKWMDSVGLDNCFAHLEFKLIDNVPALIEINPRPAGGYINKLVELVRGVDLTNHSVDLALNKPLNIDFELNEKVAGIKFILPPKEGNLQSIDIPQELKSITEYKITTSKKLVYETTSGDDRIGYVISTGRTAQDCDSINRSFIENLKFNYLNEEKINV